MLRRLAFALFVVGSAAACSAPPENERQQAEGAVNAARQADAATYAPDELHAAEASLKKYDDAVAQRDYRQALNDALDARDRAYQAAKQAGNRKADLRSQAEKLIGDLDTLTRTANARLTGSTGPRLTGAAAERVRTALRASSPALQESRALLARQDYQGAVQALSPVVTALRRELTPGESTRPR